MSHLNFEIRMMIFRSQREIPHVFMIMMDQLYHLELRHLQDHCLRHLRASLTKEVRKDIRRKHLLVTAEEARVVKEAKDHMMNFT